MWILTILPVVISILTVIHPDAIQCQVFVGVGGSAPENSTCHFPFNYDSREYHTCTCQAGATPWCAITSDISIDGLFGFCIGVIECPGENATSHKCAENFQGNLCENCTAPWYGLYCNQTCTASNCKTQCARFSSLCEECIEGYFGEQCDQRCGHCIENVCNRENGACDCKPGYFGALCTSSCSYCNNDECDTESGICQSGCKAGFTTNCTEETLLANTTEDQTTILSAATTDSTPSPNSAHEETIRLLTIVLPITLGGTCIILAGIVIACVIMKKAAKAKRRQSRSSSRRSSGEKHSLGKRSNHSTEKARYVKKSKDNEMNHLYQNGDMNPVDRRHNRGKKNSAGKKKPVDKKGTVTSLPIDEYLSGSRELTEGGMKDML